MVQPIATRQRFENAVGVSLRLMRSGTSLQKSAQLARRTHEPHTSTLPTEFPRYFEVQRYTQGMVLSGRRSSVVKIHDLTHD